MAVMDVGIGGGSHVANPCKRFLKYSSGVLKEYNKETKKNIELKPPITFYEVATLGCVTGWHELSNSSIFSNEVFDGQTPFVVKSQLQEVLGKGLWKDIKESVKAKGGRYTASIYALMDEQLVNIKISGAALQSWFNKKEGTRILFSGNSDEKKGSVSYKIPVFETFSLDNKESNDLNSKVQPLVDFLEAKKESYERSYKNQEANSVDTSKHTVDKSKYAGLDEVTAEDLPF